MLQEQIINEINHIPSDKLNELYDLIHYFRLGLLHEQQELDANKAYPLLGVKIRYDEPFEPVWIIRQDTRRWQAIKGQHTVDTENKIRENQS
jgi:hypothetical protein